MLSYCCAHGRVKAGVVHAEHRDAAAAVLHFTNRANAKSFVVFIANKLHVCFDVASGSAVGFGSLTTPTLHHVGMYVVLFLLHSNSESLRYNLRATVQGSFFI